VRLPDGGCAVTGTAARCRTRSAGAHSSASQLGLLGTVALVVALPLVAGSAMRTLDPLSGPPAPAARPRALARHRRRTTITMTGRAGVVTRAITGVMMPGMITGGDQEGP
jgi:hypothetical protein